MKIKVYCRADKTSNIQKLKNNGSKYGKIQIFFVSLHRININKLMMTTVTNQNTGTPSRLSRLQDAYDYKIKHGWTPLTPEEEVEFHKMVAEFTNL